MLTVSVLGCGRANCGKLGRRRGGRRARAHSQADFATVPDMRAILADDLVCAPGLVVNDMLVSSDQIPNVAEAKPWLSHLACGPMSP